MNLTLVAYYGPKEDGEVRGLIETAQGLLREALKTAFDSYDIEQVHGTIVGLEGTRVGNLVINTNFVRRRQSLKAFSLQRAIEIAGSMPQFDIRIGGFKDGTAYPFTSRGLHPYLRSFSIQGDIAVAMGWPVDGDRFPLHLDRLRKKFTAANALHAYHSALDDIDNDFYFVLGRIKRSEVSDLALQLLQEKMRDALAELDPVGIRIDKSCLRIVAYSDARLPSGECQAFSLEDAARNVANLVALYDELPTA